LINQSFESPEDQITAPKETVKKVVKVLSEGLSDPTTLQSLSLDLTQRQFADTLAHDKELLRLR
jgi:hypothetical protein